MVRIVNVRVLFSAIVLSALQSGLGLAQTPTTSSYTNSLLNGIRNQNSASRYSVANIQRQNLNSSVAPIGVPGINRMTFGSINGNMSAPRKPFSTLQRGPSVSPYLALSNPFTSSTDYYSIIKPQQEQRRMTQQLARQQYMQEKKLNQIAAQGPYSIQGDEERAGTGHPSAYMYLGNFMTTGNYFPPPTQPKQEQ